VKPFGAAPEETFDFPEPPCGEEFSDSQGALASRWAAFADLRFAEKNEVAAVPGSDPATPSYPQLTTMETNPLNHGVITESGIGIGPVTRKMIRERAAEIGLINGHPASEVTLTEWDQAKRELTGGPAIGPKTALLLSAPEADRWNPVPGSAGHQAPVSGSEDEDAEGQNEAAQLFAEGVNEAAHDQMLQAARAVPKPDESSL